MLKPTKLNDIKTGSKRKCQTEPSDIIFWSGFYIFKTKEVCNKKVKTINTVQEE